MGVQLLEAVAPGEIDVADEGDRSVGVRERRLGRWAMNQRSPGLGRLIGRILATFLVENPSAVGARPPPTAADRGGP